MHYWVFNQFIHSTFVHVPHEACLNWASVSGGHASAANTATHLLAKAVLLFQASAILRLLHESYDISMKVFPKSVATATFQREMSALKESALRKRRFSEMTLATSHLFKPDPNGGGKCGWRYTDDTKEDIHTRTYAGHSTCIRAVYLYCVDHYNKAHTKNTKTSRTTRHAQGGGDPNL